MKRWTRIAACVVGAMLCGVRATAEEKRRPNVLFIVCDDLNRSLGCYGNTVVKTPNIDRLASMGVRFERAYCQWPLCWPSRHSFLSGRRPTAVFGRSQLLRDVVPDVVYFPEHFRKNGWFTARVGKIFHTYTVFRYDPPRGVEDPACWDVSEIGGTPYDPCGYAVTFSDSPKGLPSRPELQKITAYHELLNKAGGPASDYWMDMAALNAGDEDVTDGVISKRISELMEEHDRDKSKPWFLAAGFRRPHLLWVAPKKYFDMFRWQDMTLPQEPADVRKGVPKEAFTRGAPDMSEENRKKAIAAYYACVAMVDHNVGVLLETMDRLKAWDNTIVVFTSDHGWHLGEHGSLWGKVTLFEESAKVPLIVVAPGMKDRGQVSPRTVEMIDFFPTLCDMAGLAKPEKIEGHSIVAQLNDPGAERAEPAFSVLRRGKTWGKAVYTEAWRYTEWGDDGSHGVELYDLRKDPKEWHNLAGEGAYAGEAAKLQASLRRVTGRLKDGDKASDGPGD